ncbi:MAG TPA: hypothetical protein VF155_01945 [Candidatus Dormibacteraeota bacterium]
MSVVAVSAATAIAFVPQVRAASTAAPEKPSCAYGTFSRLCTEVDDYQNTFGYYVGHDEPSVLFYSNSPGSGNHMQYNVTLPAEPTEASNKTPTLAHSYQNSPAFWFGMAMCDTQSYPEQSDTCTPDSDSNIVNPAVSGSFRNAPGAAFQELQFYPPGWVPQFAGSSCDPTKWCVALTIDSLSENPIQGLNLNATCQAQILGGQEYVNFAFLTLSGSPIGPPNPLQFNPATSGNPVNNPNVFFMNQGDNVTVSLHDTSSGLQTQVTDNTTHTSGLMTASAANGFGQIKFNASTTHPTCKELPYDFHPMYSTSSPQTRVLWAAHSYNIAMDVETGHFDFCSKIDHTTLNCTGKEGATNFTGGQEATDGDDTACFGPTTVAPPLLYQTKGCENQNDPGFDGTSFQANYWPNSLTPTTAATPFLFSSPLSGANGSATFTTAYPDSALETDLPRIEDFPGGQNCTRFTGDHGSDPVGDNCTNPPLSDDATPASFYPYFSTANVGPSSACDWGGGANWSSGQPGGNSHGGSSAQYGPGYLTAYWLFGGHGADQVRLNNYNSSAVGGSATTPSTISLASNPC